MISVTRAYVHWQIQGTAEEREEVGEEEEEEFQPAIERYPLDPLLRMWTWSATSA